MHIFAFREKNFYHINQTRPEPPAAGATSPRLATRAHGAWQEEGDDGGRVRAHERGRRVVLGPVRPGGAVAQAQADGLAAPALPDVRARRRRAQLRPGQLLPELRRREGLSVRARLPGREKNFDR